MRLSSLVSGALFSLSLLAGDRLLAGAQAGALPGATPPMGWGFALRMSDLSAGLLDVELRLPAATGGEPLSLCLFMDGAGAFVRELSALDAPTGSRLQADPDDADCWQVLPSAPGAGPRFPSRLKYRLDLKGMAARRGEPDYAEAIDGTYVWNEQAVLLHPSPLPKGAKIAIELTLPPGTPLATPWREVGGPTDATRRFDSDSDQHDHGSYIVWGPRLRELGMVSLPTGTTSSPAPASPTALQPSPPALPPAQARLYLIDLPHRASDAALRIWMTSALSAVSSFYRELMPSPVTVTLIPLGNSRTAGLYGSVLRPLRPSAQIFFGGAAESFSLGDDWLATHELFHVGNPFLTGRLPWLVEGFTTYYEEVLRARAGALSTAAAWGELMSGFSRHCQPEDGHSLADDSARMRQSHNYQRVYWGGACLAFMVDVAIRSRSSGHGGKPGGVANLDDLMRELRRRSLRQPLDEAEILAALDAAAGDRLASRLLRQTGRIAVREQLLRLGVRPSNEAQIDRDASRYPVTFDDRAPLAAIRRALF
ncbi:hypothetical protein [Haliangium sp. UPWRP_2]|uniref:M61 family metallopeptidase n=1 Tax=Haliangium sp. UPWRP_2 TaxID=1931276 RepID=UPI000B53E3F4|nr:hypothetical protein [Haliangium sp. UPWRP_2]PSM32138.1 hypothetical protein BVG81_001735 [Haliangium sp. UPWRP_2]